MDNLTLCLRATDGSETNIYFPDRQSFFTFMAQTMERRKSHGQYAKNEEIVSRFTGGVGFEAKEIPSLMRALRHFDEVYLCNELYDALENAEGDIALARLI